MAQKRTRRLLFVLPFALVALLTGLLCLAIIGYDTGPMGFLLGFAMAVIPVPFYITFSLWIDRFEPEPPWLLAMAFVWGAAIATFFSLISNTINGVILAQVAGDAAAQTLGAVLSAPFVEELTKGLALLLLFWWQKDEFDNVTDGIVYATMVGLGFAMTENVQYYGQAVAKDGVGAIAVFVLRGMMGPFAHPLFTSMTGIGLGAARESDNKAVKVLAPLAGLGMAMFLHFLWNLSASFGAMFFVAYVVIMVPAFVALMLVAVFSLKREARIIRQHLETIAADGVVSSADIEALCSVRGRIAASFKALTTRGYSAWKARRAFHSQATDLAFHSWHVSRGMTEADLERRNELLSAVRQARTAAGLEPIAAPPAPEIIRRFTLEMPLPSLESANVGAIVCTSGALTGQSFSIGSNGALLGRDPSTSQVVVNDPRVSKKHAWIGEREGRLMVIDRGSTNGTFVNGTRVRETAIVPGDRIALSEAAVFQVQPA